jgi:hypothetical protein
MARPPHKRNHDVLLAALACGASQEKAAQQAGVSRSTVQRRLADPAFQRQLEAFRAELVQRTTAVLTASGLEFVKTLVALTSADTPAPTRLGAARAGLEMAAKYRELADIEQRLRALEQRQAESQAADYCGASA